MVPAQLMSMLGIGIAENASFVPSFLICSPEFSDCVILVADDHVVLSQ